MAAKKSICVDFDGVLHRYDSGWKGVCEIPDPPVSGAVAWLIELTADPRFEVCVYSSRSKDPAAIEAMKTWLLHWGTPENVVKKLVFPVQKPAAFLTIDDRAICFTGVFPSIDEIDGFRPWNKK